MIGVKACYTVCAAIKTYTFINAYHRWRNDLKSRGAKLACLIFRMSADDANNNCSCFNTNVLSKSMGGALKDFKFFIWSLSLDSNSVKQVMDPQHSGLLKVLIS